MIRELATNVMPSSEGGSLRSSAPQESAEKGLFGKLFQSFSENGDTKKHLSSEQNPLSEEVIAEEILPFFTEERVFDEIGELPVSEEVLTDEMLPLFTEERVFDETGELPVSKEVLTDEMLPLFTEETVFEKGEDLPLTGTEEVVSVEEVPDVMDVKEVVQMETVNSHIQETIPAFPNGEPGNAESIRITGETVAVDQEVAGASREAMTVPQPTSEETIVPADTEPAKNVQTMPVAESVDNGGRKAKAHPETVDKPLFSTSEISGANSGSSLSDTNEINLSTENESVVIKEKTEVRTDNPAPSTGRESGSNGSDIGFSATVSKAVSSTNTQAEHQNQTTSAKADGSNAAVEIPAMNMKHTETLHGDARQIAAGVQDQVKTGVAIPEGGFRIVTDKKATDTTFKKADTTEMTVDPETGVERSELSQRAASALNVADTVRPGRILSMNTNGAAAAFSTYGEAEPAETMPELPDDIQIISDGKSEMPEFERQAQNSMRMGEFTIQNELVRRSILPSVSQVISTATSEGKQLSAQWQKHHVELDNGTSIQLSTRQVDGVIQLKLASDNPELTKLLQQHLDDIKARLEEEYSMNVELELDSRGSEQQASAGFSDQQTGQRRAGAIGHNSSEVRSKQSATGQHIEQSVRRFGYNQMEWTA